ncbi:class I SAM-dependent methyltransferase [Chelatococcus asaccharovorans]|nr:class I SAM-dependent methyltransferase [Chelatococcus asaccharovorans]MBS7702268.1 class I SAM-dependent methyltransferase [Chelatococcus asaccharovorans]
MMAQDKTTLSFYANEAAAYTSRGAEANRRRLDAFLSLLPAGATILELGCGAGQDSEFMIAKGFNVRPTDGTPEIARAAERRLGIPVATLLFGDLDEEGTCDGIWANACLLHVPRADLPPILAKIHAALNKGGVLYASFKAGTADGRDQFDRYYNYPSEDWLRDLFAPLPWISVDIDAEKGGGYDMKPTDWLHVTAVKPR